MRSIPTSPSSNGSHGGDRPAFFQLRTMLQGVVARGTARAIGQLSPYVGGKTGTSDDENDAWFVGFTNDVTIGVWVGYDNADGKRRTLGGGQTGGRVAVPIFEQIVQATWARCTPSRRRSIRRRRRPRRSSSPCRSISPAAPASATAASGPSPNSSGCATARSPTPSTTWCRSTRWRPRMTAMPGDMATVAAATTLSAIAAGLLPLRWRRPRQLLRPVRRRPDLCPAATADLSAAAQPNYGGQFGELRSRSSEDRRFVAPRRVDPDYPYRGQRY